MGRTGRRTAAITPSAIEPDLRYRVYGLALRANAPIDGLVARDDTGPADVTVRFGAANEAPGEFLIEYADGTRFAIATDASEIRCYSPSDSTLEDAATYLLGPVLAFVLRARGTLALHASAIVTRGGAVLIAGAPGAGKSTTAAACARGGLPVITEDVAPIAWRDERPFVLPGYPRVRVWSDVAAALWGSEDALPFLTPTWSKRYVDLTRGEYAFAAQEQPIAAVCVLAGRAAEPSLRRVAGHEAAMAVLRNTSVTETLFDSMRELELAQVARLASAVPVFELIAPDDLPRAGEICALLESAAF
ncbi:MAG TPA: hypothetical protein VHL59_19235 [Thermoanaerobaculia bacterium]|nr:hypothetical protein [Thermoanaerobaculia bacterium]